jgi:hypothetical protein
MTYTEAYDAIVAYMIGLGYKQSPFGENIKDKSTADLNEKGFSLESNTTSVKLLIDRQGVIVYPFKMVVKYIMMDSKQYAESQDLFYEIAETFIADSNFLGFTAQPKADPQWDKQVIFFELEFEYGMR